MQDTSQAEESFEEHVIQRKIQEITRALKKALDAAENASTEINRIQLPNPACALVGVFGWWLSRGSVGSASGQCGFSGVWCRHVVRRWQDHAASRLQRWRRRPFQLVFSDPAYFPICEMLLNGQRQFQDHVSGKKHRNHLKRQRLAPYAEGQ